MSLNINSINEKSITFAHMFRLQFNYRPPPNSSFASSFHPPTSNFEWIFPCRCMQGSITTTTDFLYGIDDCEPVQEGIYDYLPNLRKVPADQGQDNLELPPNNDIASKSNKNIMYHTLLSLPLKCCHNLILNSSLLQNRLPRSDFRITLRRIIISAHSGSCCYYVMVNIYSTPIARYCLLCSVIRCYN